MITDKKIMILSTTDNMIWQFLLPHIRYFQEHGNTVECVCSKTGFWFDELRDKFGLSMHEIDFGRNPIKLKNFKAYGKLKDLQKTENFDLIYCQQPVGGMMGRLLAKKYKVPCIYTAHGFHFFNGCPLVNKLVCKNVEKWLSKYTDILITINEEDYQNALKMKAKQVFKISGIGIDTQKLNVPEFDKQAFKEELGIPKYASVITTISELNQNKNYITMLQAIKEMSKTNKEIRFVSCGTGVWAEKIKAYAEEMEIQDLCVFLGFRKDISKILQITDVFMHASYREGLTLSVMEAMSLGLPCVVSNVRGNRDLIVDGKGGFVVEPEDFVGFAEKTQMILADKELAAEMKDFNKKQSEQYTVENVKKELAQIYEQL